jgi:tetratricopeptide (TPR) repeat protein
MKIGEWLAGEGQRFRETKDEARLKLADYSSQGYELRERDPDQAIALFREARRQAEALNEPWWALFYQTKLVEALLHFKRDHGSALDLAVEGVMEARKPTNAQFPGNVAAWDNLVAAYLGIDAEGYEEAIVQALDHLDREIPPEPEGPRYLLLARRESFAVEMERYKDAYDACMKALNLAGSDPRQSRAVHFATFVYCTLCQVASTISAWDTLAEWSKIGEELARTVGHQCELGEVLAWQAVAALQQGNADQAQRAFQNATAHMGHIKMPPKRGYFDALEIYHEKRGEPDKALALREAELESVRGQGRLLYETRVHFKRALWRARLGMLAPADLEQAREAARKLRKPERHLERIGQLARAARLE